VPHLAHSHPSTHPPAHPSTHPSIPTAASWPQLQQTLQQPGAQEFARDVSSNLSRRFLARAIKFTFGVPEGLRSAATAAVQPPQQQRGSRLV